MQYTSSYSLSETVSGPKEGDILKHRTFTWVSQLVSCHSGLWIILSAKFNILSAKNTYNTIYIFEEFA